MHEGVKCDKHENFTEGTVNGAEWYDVSGEYSLPT